MTTVLGVGFVIMYAVYTWLDISWDSRLTPMLGLAIAMCSLPIPERSSGAVPAVGSSASAPTGLPSARGDGAVRRRERSRPG